MTAPQMDLLGIGIGPFNLSLAALLNPLKDTAACFLDRKQRFAWHPGLMLPQTRLQTSFLKDLVTAVDPKSPYSFLAYLVEKGRFYEFLNADFKAICRAEFADYLAWAAGRLPALSFGVEVREIDFDGRNFVVRSDGKTGYARNLSVALGQQRQIPAWAEPLQGSRCFHGAELLEQRPDAKGQRVAIIGGGQTGAEIFLAFAQGQFGSCRALDWISLRPNFEPLDETHFTNEYFTPDYQRSFSALPAARKPAILEEQKLASDGISPSTLAELYQLLYQERHFAGNGERYRLRPGREALGLDKEGAVFRITSQNQLTEESEFSEADLVILCTGYRSELPEALAPLAGRLSCDQENRPLLDAHFKAEWDGPADRRLYLQNYSRHSHGIADPQLSLMAWRSATIVNDLLGRSVYKVDGESPLITWQQDPASAETRVEAA